MNRIGIESALQHGVGAKILAFASVVNTSETWMKLMSQETNA